MDYVLMKKVKYVVKKRFWIYTVTCCYEQTRVILYSTKRIDVK